MDRNLPLDVVVAQRQSLLAQLQQEREQIEALRAVVENLMEQLRTRQHVLDEIDSVLGMTPQLRLDEGSVLLRGRRLSEVAVEVLEEEKGTAVTVHYREWFELVRSRGVEHLFDPDQSSPKRRKSRKSYWGIPIDFRSARVMYRTL
jgi:chaperonin cofactor prefoldin